VEMQVTLEDMYNGNDVSMSIKRRVVCRQCKVPLSLSLSLSLPPSPFHTFLPPKNPSPAYVSQLILTCTLMMQSIIGTIIVIIIIITTIVIVIVIITIIIIIIIMIITIIIIISIRRKYSTVEA
jgi:hypothetical protein